jgi:hypothetical protein
MKTYGVIIVPPFLNSAVDGAEWTPSRAGRFTPGETAPFTHRIEGWLCPRSGLDSVEKRKSPLPGIEHQPYNPYSIVMATGLY